MTPSKLVLPIFILIVNTACIPQNNRPTTSINQPSIVIHDVSKEQIANLLIEGKLQQGWKLDSSNDYGVVFIREIDNFAARVTYGSKFNRTPAARITYNMINVSGGVKVIVKSEMVTNPNSPYEKSRDFTSTWGEDAQKELERIKVIAERK